MYINGSLHYVTRYLTLHYSYIDGELVRAGRGIVCVCRADRYGTYGMVVPWYGTHTIPPYHHQPPDTHVERSSGTIPYLHPLIFLHYFTICGRQADNTLVGGMVRVPTIPPYHHTTSIPPLPTIAYIPPTTPTTSSSCLLVPSYLTISYQPFPTSHEKSRRGRLQSLVVGPLLPYPGVGVPPCEP